MKLHATLTGAILDHLRQDGGQIFCHLKPVNQPGFTAISYHQLVQRARCYLRHYQTLGIAPGAPGGICGGGTP